MSKSTAPGTNSQKSVPASPAPETEKKSNYLHFMQKSNADFLARNPDKTPAEIRTLKNQHWANLTKQEKEEWGKTEVSTTQMTPPSFGKPEPQETPKAKKNNKSNKPKKVSGYNIFYR